MVIVCKQCPSLPTRPCEHVLALYNQRYYVTQDGHAITEPMTAADIVAKFGTIRELEANGFRVVPA